MQLNQNERKTKRPRNYANILYLSARIVAQTSLHWRSWVPRYKWCWRPHASTSRWYGSFPTVMRALYPKQKNHEKHNNKSLDKTQEKVHGDSQAIHLGLWANVHTETVCLWCQIDSWNELYRSTTDSTFNSAVQAFTNGILWCIFAWNWISWTTQ